MDRNVFFDSWFDVARVLLLAPASYAVMVAVLRATGKRTLSKLNAFDLVVTVALGSVLATIALSSEVSLAEGIAAMISLITLQWVVSWASTHIELAGRAVRAEATVVFRNGAFDRPTMLSTRLTDGEIRQAIRSSGYGDLGKVAAVVLETDGSLSVIPCEQCDAGDALPGGASREPDTSVRRR